MPISVALRDWGLRGMIIAIMVNLFLVGIWHGANWTFAVFGLYHGLLFIPLIVSGEFQKKQKIKFKGYVPNAGFLWKMVGTYLLVAVGLIIFRAPSVEKVWLYVVDICSAGALFSISNKMELMMGMLFAIGIMLLEWRAFLKGKIEYAIQCKIYTWSTYLIDFVILMILFSCSKILDNAQFIYMRF